MPCKRPVLLISAGPNVRTGSTHFMNQKKDAPEMLKTVSFQPAQAFMGAVKGEAPGGSC